MTHSQEKFSYFELHPSQITGVDLAPISQISRLCDHSRQTGTPQVIGLLQLRPGRWIRLWLQYAGPIPLSWVETQGKVSNKKIFWLTVACFKKIEELKGTQS